MKAFNTLLLLAACAVGFPAVADGQRLSGQEALGNPSPGASFTGQLIKVPPKPLTLSLWPDGKAPNGDGTFDQANATITIHKPLHPNGAAALICPGGAYGTVVILSLIHI